MSTTTVVLVARDQRHGLARSLPTLMAQTRPAGQVLVVDLASADGTEDWLRVRWPGVEHLRLPRADLPPAACLDAALARVGAERVAFAAPGDLWPRTALDRLAAAGDAALTLPCERLVARGGDAPPRAEPLPEGHGLSGLCCPTGHLRRPAQGAATLAAEILGRLGTAPIRLADAPALTLPAAPSGAPAMSPAGWADGLAVLARPLPPRGPFLLVGLDAADRPAALLDLLGHALAVAREGRLVQAFTLADLDWAQLEQEAPLLVTCTTGFGPGEAALQLAFEELLRRAGERRPVRLAVRRLGPSSLVLGGRLIEAVRRHPDVEIWVTDRVSRSYAASLLGPRVRLAPPGIAGLAGILGAFRSRYAGLLPPLGPAAIRPEDLLRDLDGWHGELGREAAQRLGQVLARLAGTAPLLRTAALQEAWSLILPGWAALASGEEEPLRTGSLDAALFACLSGRPCELRPITPGAAAFMATWEAMLAPAGLRLVA